LEAIEKWCNAKDRKLRVVPAVQAAAGKESDSKLKKEMEEWLKN
jgi:hypothetical protein